MKPDFNGFTTNPDVMKSKTTGVNKLGAKWACVFFVFSLPVAAQQASATWADKNRFVEISGGSRLQNYRETDTNALTSNGILNTETGQQDHIGLALRWQGISGWLFHLQAQRQSGTTDYNGYLQTGSGSLIPYTARTGNTASQRMLSLGYALHAHNWPALPATVQITPLVQIARQRWERDLVQYSEAYDFNTYALGAMLQWQAHPGTVLEAQVLAGRTQPASVQVPALGFAAQQSGGSLYEWQITLTQDLQALTRNASLASWRAVARYTQSQFAHGVSPIVNGLQAPPNQHKPGTWVLGVQKQF